MTPLELLFATLRSHRELHVPGTPGYQLLKGYARSEIERLFAGTEGAPQPFGPFGELALPYTRMGAIDSLDLFGLDELIIFAFYDANRARYRRAVDIGANLGLHSIILGRCGLAVKAFEPDPRHFGILSGNLSRNHLTTVEPIQAAVSTQDGSAEFVRVLGNTTGSHLAGAKDSYGEREVFSVAVRAAAPLLAAADFAKIDAEGHEREILLAAAPEELPHLDIMVEIGSPANAAAVFRHFTDLGIGLFPQKLGWRRATQISDLPTSHRDGSLFISAKAAMPW
jgi:FkbM family methyltransferase